jgi:putative oxygen-independent coproporphyrinogen III oxidase
MPTFTNHPPLSLYIHLPWCKQKCPYCDFNSHAIKDHLPEESYVCALLQQLDRHLDTFINRPIISIFFGGGTPSLFSPVMIERILNGVHQRCALVSDIEITMEANPGTVDQDHFFDYRLAGINRLSLGLQSLQNDKLKVLGRIHDKDQALRAINIAQESGFENINFDLMFGLPNQTIEDALSDIKMALQYHPQHFSWYQLTIEPNTFFYHQPPVLPNDDLLWEMQLAGQHILQDHGFQQYEVSAYARTNKECRHNRNYWEFGDYLGIGAGAHSKITDIHTDSIVRFSQTKHPKLYLSEDKNTKQLTTSITEKNIIFEFMLNALRLTDGVPLTLFTERTGLDHHSIEPLLQKGISQGLLQSISHPHIVTTENGKKYLNNLIEIFLP